MQVELMDKSSLLKSFYFADGQVVLLFFISFLLHMQERYAALFVAFAKGITGG